MDLEDWMTTNDSPAEEQQTEVIEIIQGNDAEHTNRLNDGDILGILPLKNKVLFSNILMPVTVSRPKSLKLVKETFEEERLLAVVSQKDKNIAEPGSEDIYRLGVAAKIIRIIPMSDNTQLVIMQGIERIYLDEIVESNSYLMGRVHVESEDIPDEDTEFITLATSIQETTLRVFKKMDNMPQDAYMGVKALSYPPMVVNYVAANFPMTIDERQKLLEINSLKERAIRLLEILNKEENKLSLKQEIKKKTEEELNKNQREYYLQQQMHTIQKELGNTAEKDVNDLRERANNKKWSQQVADTFAAELRKLERMGINSPEYSTQLNYLETMLSLPWGEYTKDNLDIKNAQRVLDKDHFGMEDVKERILEHLAVLKQIQSAQDSESISKKKATAKESISQKEAIVKETISPKEAIVKETFPQKEAIVKETISPKEATTMETISGKEATTMEVSGKESTASGKKACNTVPRTPILCLYGPPGVGKTSLGKSIATALGRKYARISLGGLHDESEIRGHRKTYIGAMPGRIIESLKKVQSGNPVFVLDEIDKITTDFHGDPNSALLEVLDPEQNSAFHDNYLDIDYDLSKVLFIATANSLQSIPRPLLDRMELIEMTGYLQEEKEQICKKHLIPKELEAHGLTSSDLKFSTKAIRSLIDDYTRESGVRELDRQVQSVIRKVIKCKALEEAYNTTLQPSDIREYLGKPRYSRDRYETNEYPGVVTGLAWTQVGGEILFIETSLSPSKTPTLTLTGNLGDVMKESATIALGYIRAHAADFGINQEDLDNKSVHLHVPEGAIPKDGPSAGITMTTAMISAFTGRKVRERVAMTGEMTLRGKVLPVGGIKEKILAAKRAGITDIILCYENEKDILEIKEEYVRGVSFHYVHDIHEVVEFALL